MPDWSLRRHRMLALVIILSLGSLSYWLVAWLGHARPQCGHLDGWWDRAIPLWAPALIGYLSLAPFTVLVAWQDDATAFTRCLRAALLAMVVAYLGFCIQPISVVRGPLPTAAFWHGAYGLVRAIDPPWNSFPSLHVADAMLVWLAIPRRWWSALWALAIIASTVLTHQHVLWDVAGGLVLAAIAWRVAAASWYQRLLPAHPLP